MWLGAAKWGADVWFPDLRANGLQAFTWIYSSGMLSRLATNKTLTHAKHPDYIRTFDDAEEAKVWLRSKKTNWAWPKGKCRPQWY